MLRQERDGRHNGFMGSEFKGTLSYFFSSFFMMRRGASHGAHIYPISIRIKYHLAERLLCSGK